MTEPKNLLASLPLLFCSLLTGCHNVVIPYAPPVPATTGTGNWFFVSYTQSRNGTGPYNFGGSLINTGGQLSGVLHIDQPCFGSYTTDIPYTGTLDAKNNINITSSRIEQQTATLTGTLSANASTISNATLTVLGGCTGSLLATSQGSGPSEMHSFGVRIPALTDTWTSTNTFPGPPFTEQLTQSPTPDVHGDYTLTGTVTVQGSPCFTQGTLQPGSFVSGLMGHQTILMNDGSTLNATLLVIPQIVPNPTKPQLLLELVTITGDKCSAPFEIELQ